MENGELNAIKSIQNTYGMKSISIRYIQDKTILDSNTNNISFILDSNYNIIDIVKSNIPDEKYIDNTFNYTKLSYPFDSYNVSDVIDIAKNTCVSRGIGAPKLDVKDELLTYIKFLNILIEDYYSISYKMQTLGYEMPSITSYTDSIINRISKMVISDLRLHVRPTTMEVMSSIGQKEDYIVYYNHIKNIINLYIDNMGLKQSLDSTKGFEYIDDTDRENVKFIADNLLDEYNLSKKEKVLK